MLMLMLMRPRRSRHHILHSLAPLSGHPVPTTISLFLLLVVVVVTLPHREVRNIHRGRRIFFFSSSSSIMITNLARVPTST